MRWCALGSLWRDRCGATALEFALVAPLLFALLFGTLDLGRWLWTASALDFAVARAARCAAVTPELCPNRASIAAAAVAASPIAGFPLSAFTAQDASCGIEVTGHLPYVPLFALLAPLTPELHASACVV